MSTKITYKMFIGDNFNRQFLQTAQDPSALQWVIFFPFLSLPFIFSFFLLPFPFPFFPFPSTLNKEILHRHASIHKSKEKAYFIIF